MDRGHGAQAHRPGNGAAEVDPDGLLHGGGRHASFIKPLLAAQQRHVSRGGPGAGSQWQESNPYLPSQTDRAPLSPQPTTPRARGRHGGGALNFHLRAPPLPPLGLSHGQQSTSSPGRLTRMAVGRQNRHAGGPGTGQEVCAHTRPPNLPEAAGWTWDAVPLTTAAGQTGTQNATHFIFKLFAPRCPGPRRRVSSRTALCRRQSSRMYDRHASSRIVTYV